MPKEAQNTIPKALSTKTSSVIQENQLVEDQSPVSDAQVSPTQLSADASFSPFAFPRSADEEANARGEQFIWGQSIQSLVGQMPRRGRSLDV